MKTGILLVSYAPDAKWAEYCLRSITRFASGFSSLTVVVPNKHKAFFSVMCATHGAILKGYELNEAKPFLHHEIIKLTADQWVPADTDLVLHIDSDCVFTAPVTPETYQHEERPILMREYYHDFQFVDPNRHQWKHCAEHALGFECKWETMCRHPGVFWVPHYAEMRAHIAARHGKSFEDFVFSCTEHPLGFTEFPTIGAFVVEKHPADYCLVESINTPRAMWNDAHWKERFGIEPGKDGRKQLVNNRDGSLTMRFVPDPLRQFWSKGSLENQRATIEALIA